MTPMDLFMWGIYALIVMGVLMVIEMFAGRNSYSYGSDDVVAMWMITGGIGTLVWIIMWAGAVVLAIINWMA
jgi:hypothetical protein